MVILGAMREKEYQSRIKVIAKRLKTLRIEAGYTSYEQFALAHGIERKQYWRLEKGHNFMITSLLRIIDIHEISLQKFFENLD